MSNKVLNIILIEDDKAECARFEKYIKTRDDVNLIATTDSDIEGLELINKHLPDAIILDIELHNGTGNANSFDLIETLQKTKFSKRPKIVVNTVVSSNTVYDYLHDKGIDLIFYKKQQNYSIENVINTLVLLSGYSEDTSLTGNIVVEDTKENEQKISNIINDELNLPRLGLHTQRRKYFHDAIYHLTTTPTR